MSDTSRRKLLKSIAAGSGAIVAGKSLPEFWSKPVVDSVILPAHAQTSTAPLPPSCQFAISETSTLPFGLTPPGPNVPVSSSGTLTVTVTPAPADGETVFLEAFIDGTPAGDISTPMTGGVATQGFLLIGVGVVELRATYDCAVTSIFINSVAVTGAGISAQVSGGDFFSR